MPPRSEPQDGLRDTWGRQNRKLADLICPSCGATFRPLRSTSRYCSRPCMWANNGKHQERVGSWSVDAKGYIAGHIWVDGKRVFKRLHRHLMEEHLGRRLLPDEDVHHINGDKQDNRLENLQVLSHSEHSQISNHHRWHVLGSRNAAGLLARVRGEENHS